MESRSSRYTENDNTSEEVFGSRTARNAGLYREIRESAVDNYNVRSNARVIDNNSGNSIDIDHIKSILDTHYNDSPKLHTIPIEEPKEKEETKPKSIFEITKEYDINTILNKAKEGREVNFEEDRVKKLRDTQFDILNNLHIDPKDYIEEYDDDNVEVTDTGVSIETSEETSKTLEDLINTIALNEKEVKKGLKIKDETEEEETQEDTDPLDIFSDLKGADNTVTLEGLQEKTQELLGELDSKLEDIKKQKEQNTSKDEDDNEIKEDKTTSLDNSFFTTATKFKKSDFEDEEFEEIEKERSGGGIVIKIIIIILVIAFLAGLAILIKSFF